MTALLIEDGTGVIGANSFATLVQARAFAALRGATLPVLGTPGDAALTAFLVKGTDYLKTFLYLGTKTYPGQDYLPFPRTNLTIDDLAIGVAVVPNDIVSALCQLCIEQNAGVVLSATSTGAGIKSEKIGPIETVYSTPNGAGNASKASMPIVAAYLKPYVRGLAIRTGRA